MDDSPSNRDIYLAIGDLIPDDARSPHRDLESYLRALLRACRSRRDAEALTANEFVAVLGEGFTADPLPYDPAWATDYHDNPGELQGFERFEARLLCQIVDLCEMREGGILDGKWIEFGVDAPRGGRWYNFEPRQYLECAAAGAMGGWEPGDPTGRQFGPGQVAALNADGRVTSADPRDLEWPTHAVDRVTWGQFEDFLQCGRIYE